MTNLYKKFQIGLCGDLAAPLIVFSTWLYMQSSFYSLKKIPTHYSLNGIDGWTSVEHLPIKHALITLYIWLFIVLLRYVLFSQKEEFSEIISQGSAFAQSIIVNSIAMILPILVVAATIKPYWFWGIISIFITVVTFILYRSLKHLILSYSSGLKSIIVVPRIIAGSNSLITVEHGRVSINIISARFYVMLFILFVVFILSIFTSLKIN